MSNCIHVGDVGTIFRLTLVDCDTGQNLDLVGASVLQMKFKKPTGPVITVNATFLTDGSDGIIQYTTKIGDLDMGGDWQIQGYVEGVGYKNSSSIPTFHVSDNL